MQVSSTSGRPHHSGGSAQQVEAANPKGRQLGRIPE
jgi:hypothetical protein